VIIWVDSFYAIISHISSHDSLKPSFPHKASLMVELEAKRDLAQKEEIMRHLMERLQRLDDSQERQNHGRRWESRRARYYMHYWS